jgi:hypothetical protein
MDLSIYLKSYAKVAIGNVAPIAPRALKIPTVVYHGHVSRPGENCSRRTNLRTTTQRKRVNPFAGPMERHTTNGIQKVITKTHITSKNKTMNVLEGKDWHRTQSKI